MDAVSREIQPHLVAERLPEGEDLLEHVLVQAGLGRRPGRRHAALELGPSPPRASGKRCGVVSGVRPEPRHARSTRSAGAALSCEAAACSPSRMCRRDRHVRAAVDASPWTLTGPCSRLRSSARRLGGVLRGVSHLQKFVRAASSHMHILLRTALITASLAQGSQNSALRRDLLLSRRCSLGFS